MQGLPAKVKMGADIIKNVGHMQDNVEMLRITVTEIEPWKNTLDKAYFPKIHEFWPERLPESWTHKEALTFFVFLAQALFHDVQVLDDNKLYH